MVCNCERGKCRNQLNMNVCLYTNPNAFTKIAGYNQSCGEVHNTNGVYKSTVSISLASIVKARY